MFGKETVFTAGERSFTVNDTMEYARATGSLARFRDRLTKALAFQELAKTEGRQMDLDLLQKRSDAYRKEHRLLGPWETIAWLKKAGQDLEELQAFLQRRYWLEQMADRAGSLPPETQPDPSKVEQLLFGEIYLGDHLGGLVADLALAAAAAVEKGEISQQAPVAELAASFRAALSREREQAVSPGRLQSRLRMESARLLRFQGQALLCPHAGAAAEALLCLQEDGEAPPDLARRAGLTLVPFSRLAADLPEQVREALLSAAEHEVAGPFEIEGRHVLVFLEAKQQPGLNDPEVLERLTALLTRETHDALLERHVQFSKLGEELVK